MAKGNELSRRKVLAMLGATGVVAGSAGAGTLAYLTDEKSINSRFEAGFLGITIEPDVLEFGDLDEGETSETIVTLCNTGTLPVRNIILNNISINGNAKLAKAIEITRLEYYKADLTDSLPQDENGNGIIDLHDTANHMERTSLTESLSDRGLDKNEDENSDGECKELKFITKIDYSKLQEGADGETVTATLDIKAEQKPLESESSPTPDSN